MFYELLVLFFAGIGAGIVTGLLGASAAVIAAPIIILLLGYDAFTAIGISLVVDVFASSVSAYNFNKHKHLHLRSAWLILCAAVIGAFFGSYFSSGFDPGLLSNFMGIGIALTGIHLIKRDVKKEITFFRDNIVFKRKSVKSLMLILIGLCVGAVAGIVGFGGGIALLLTLTILLSYRIHPAIGTSVFIMAFITLSGAIGHLVYGHFSPTDLVIASLGGIVGAFFASKKATSLPEKELNVLVGSIFFLLGLLLIAQQILGF